MSYLVLFGLEVFVLDADDLGDLTGRGEERHLQEEHTDDREELQPCFLFLFLRLVGLEPATF